MHYLLLNLCRRRFIVTIAEKIDDENENADPNSDGGLFSYGEKDLCSVRVQGVVWPLTSSNETAFIVPKPQQINPGTVYKLHAGYRRLLLGFTREINFAQIDKLGGHNFLFRATYLFRVLDHFARELEEGLTPGQVESWEFRSRVLNPILQRQMRGVYDHEPKMIELTVGGTLDDVGKFYLTEDPLAPRCINTTRRAILYILPVRLSLAFLSCEMPKESYDRGRENTSLLMGSKGAADAKFRESTTELDTWENKVVLIEKLERFYHGLVKPGVSGCLASQLCAFTCFSTRRATLLSNSSKRVILYNPTQITGSSRATLLSNSSKGVILYNPAQITGSSKGRILGLGVAARTGTKGGMAMATGPPDWREVSPPKRSH